MLPVWVKMAFSHIFPYWDPENTLCIITSWKIIQLTSNLHGSKRTLRTNILESLIKKIYPRDVTWHHVTWFSDFRLKILWKLAEKVLTSAKYGQDRFSKLSFFEKAIPYKQNEGSTTLYDKWFKHSSLFSWRPIGYFCIFLHILHAQFFGLPGKLYNFPGIFAFECFY